MHFVHLGHKQAFGIPPLKPCELVRLRLHRSVDVQASYQVYECRNVSVLCAEIVIPTCLYHIYNLTFPKIITNERIGKCLLFPLLYIFLSEVMISN